MISTSFFASLSSEGTRPSVLSFLVVPNDGRQQILKGAVIIIWVCVVRAGRGTDFSRYGVLQYQRQKRRSLAS
jgi:hypothetical protein